MSNQYRIMFKTGYVGRVNPKTGEMFAEKLSLFARFLCLVKSVYKTK